MTWAVDCFHIVEARAAVTCGAATAVLGWDARRFLAFVEGILRDSSGHNEKLDEVYASSMTVAARRAEAERRSAGGRVLSRAERNRRIDEFMRLSMR